MDYEWENKQGPVDYKSPFMNIPPPTNNTVKKRNESRLDFSGSNELTSGPSSASAGPHSVLDSPSKGFATPNRPQLREPNSQHFLFSQNESKPLPAVPSHVQDSRLWEPRTPVSVIDFSSGGETPNTPLHDDSEATPDTGLRRKMSRMLTDGGDRKSPKKTSRRDSWLGALFSKSSPSKSDSRSHYSNKAENRVMKRRQKKAMAKVEDADYSDDETERERSRRGRRRGKDQDADLTPTQQDQQPPRAGYTVGDFFSYIETHPSLPHILSWYMQLVLNFFLVFGAIYVLYSIWHAITTEVDIQARKSMSEIMMEIATCARNYEDNRCNRATRVPAMENACSNWEACMQRDPKKVARASVTARTFAMIFNSFVEEFSYKAMVCYGGSILLLRICGFRFFSMPPYPRFSTSHLHED
jgi:hypothetical protein